MYPLTALTWKWAETQKGNGWLKRRSFPFGARPIFRCYCWQPPAMYKTLQIMQKTTISSTGAGFLNHQQYVSVREGIHNVKYLQVPTGRSLAKARLRQLAHLHWRLLRIRMQQQRNQANKISTNLGGGWTNPFEKYAPIGSPPVVGVKIKMFETTIQKI